MFLVAVPTLNDLLSDPQLKDLLAQAGKWDGKNVDDLMPVAIGYAEIVGQICLDAAPFTPTRRDPRPRDPIHRNGRYVHGGHYAQLSADNPMLKEAWRPFRQIAMRNGHPDWVSGKLAETIWAWGKAAKSGGAVADQWWWLAVDQKARGLYLNDGTVERVLVNHLHAAVERLVAQDGESVVVVGKVISDLEVDQKRRQMKFTIDAGGYTKDLASDRYPSRVVIHDQPANIGADLCQGRTVKVQGRYKLVKGANGKSDLLIVADRNNGVTNL